MRTSRFKTGRIALRILVKMDGMFAWRQTVKIESYSNAPRVIGVLRSECGEAYILSSRVFEFNARGTGRKTCRSENGSTDQYS